MNLLHFSFEMGQSRPLILKYYVPFSTSNKHDITANQRAGFEWGASNSIWCWLLLYNLCYTQPLASFHIIGFLKNGPIRASFCLFSSFSRYNFNNTNWKKHRWCAWDSNPRPQDGRRRRYHGAMAAGHSELVLSIRQCVLFSKYLSGVL